MPPTGTTTLEWKAYNHATGDYPILLDPLIYGFTLLSFNCIDEFAGVTIDSTLTHVSAILFEDRIIVSVPCYALPVANNQRTSVNLEIHRLSDGVPLIYGNLKGDNLTPCPTLAVVSHSNPTYDEATVGQPYTDLITFTAPVLEISTVNSLPSWAQAEVNASGEVRISNSSPVVSEVGTVDITVRNACNPSEYLDVIYDIDSTGGGYDPDAQAFITAIGTLTTPQQDAVNDLVVAMKAAGVWSKGIVYYPMVGGTATAHKWNLFNPLDTDAAFRGTFGGGWTHNANGAQGNGINGYLQTHVFPQISLTENDVAVVYVSGTVGAHPIEFGIDSSGNNPRIVLACDYNGADAYSDIYSFSTGRVLTATPDGSGVFISSRTSSSVHKLFRNGTQLGSTNTGTPFSGGKTWSQLTRDLYFQCIAANPSGGLFGFSGRICKGAGIFTGLSDTEVANITTAINDFNTALGR